MAKSIPIVLAATGISFTNEWLQDGTVNLRIPVAGMVAGVVFSGIEAVSEPAAVGLAVILLVSVVLTPIKGKTPADTLLEYTQGKAKKT